MIDALQQIGNWLAAGHSNLAYSLIGAGTALIGFALFIRLAAPKVSWRMVERFAGMQIPSGEHLGHGDLFYVGLLWRSPCSRAAPRIQDQDGKLIA
jgi:hypothetical protein